MTVSDRQYEGNGATVRDLSERIPLRDFFQQQKRLLQSFNFERVFLVRQLLGDIEHLPPLSAISILRALANDVMFQAYRSRCLVVRNGFFAEVRDDVLLLGYSVETNYWNDEEDLVEKCESDPAPHTL